jgi:TatD DNase family protein
MNSIAYPIGNSLYLNITNRCTNHCDFCIRYKNRLFNQKHPLWLGHEPTAKEVLAAIGDPGKYAEIVFCGYGEPLIRLDTVIKIVKELKDQSSKFKISIKSKTKIRINTNGQANLFWGRNILPEIKGLINTMVISLDAQNAEVYDKICHSNYGKAAFPAILAFMKEAKKYIPQVEISVVDLPEVDLAACRKIAKELDVELRVRPYYEEAYIR